MSEEIRFMLGDSFDGLGVRSIIDFRGLIGKVQSIVEREDGRRVEEIHLKNSGIVTLEYTPCYNLMQVICSQDVPLNLVYELQEFGLQSRTRGKNEQYKQYEEDFMDGFN